MIKSLIFLLLRSALGFLLISFIFLGVTTQGFFPAEAYNQAGSQVYTWFYLATMVAWLGGVALAVGEFIGLSDAKTARWLRWAPVYIPPVYALISLIWLTQIAA